MIKNHLRKKYLHDSNICKIDGIIWYHDRCFDCVGSGASVGELFEQFHLPSVVGEILSGMLIGPSLLGLVIADDALKAVSSIALFFIIFHIGFEMKTQMIQGKIRIASLFSITSFLIPLALMLLSALFFFPFGTEANFILALAIAVPSLSIISVLIWQYNLLQTTTGQIILASVTISDILAFIIFSRNC